MFKRILQKKGTPERKYALERAHALSSINSDHVEGLIGATKANDQNQFQKLLNLKTNDLRGKAIDEAAPEYNRNHLHWATIHGYIHFINPLRKARIDINKPDKNGDVWHPAAVYTLVGLKVDDEHYSNSNPILGIYGCQLVKMQEVKALGLKQVPTPSAQIFSLKTQRERRSFSIVHKNVQQMQQETKQIAEKVETMQKTMDIAGHAQIKALQQKNEKENILEVLKKLKKFFLGQRDQGEESANFDTYEQYLKMANKDTELIYQQANMKHILCLDCNILDATAAAQAI